MKIAIIGAGKLGIRLTEALLDGDYDITVVDNNEKKLDILSQQFDVFTVLGDAKTIELLNRIDVKTFDFLIATTTSDDTNILATSFAKILGCKRVIARVREPEHMNQHDFLREHYNIDMLINPDLLITSEIYRYLVEKYTLSNGIFTSRSIALIEFEADKKQQLIGKSLIEFRTIMPDMMMVGISHKGKLRLVLCSYYQLKTNSSSDVVLSSSPDLSNLSVSYRASREFFILALPISTAAEYAFFQFSCRKPFTLPS